MNIFIAILKQLQTFTIAPHYSVKIKSVGLNVKKLFLTNMKKIERKNK